MIPGLIVMAKSWVLLFCLAAGFHLSHCSFQWMEPWVAPRQPTATVTCMPRTLHYAQQNIYADEISSAPQDLHSVPGVTDRSEPLGTPPMEGFDAVGVQHTRTLADAQTGKTIVLVTEIWYSQQLKELPEMRQTQQPESQQNQSPLPYFRLTQIHRGEPSESLFYPPDGYKVEPGN